MKPPAFWAHGQTPPWALRQLAPLYAAATARRVAQPGWTAPVPVICCGNAGAGGAGKTPLALDLARRLSGMGRRPAFLTRGHGGAVAGPARVDRAQHAAADVGDEALLLAALAPTYVGADRAATAQLAITEGADVLVMDDGLQNPTLAKTASILVIDGGAGFGNGAVIPAGPLREPVAAAAGRCRAAVLIGEDGTGARAMLPPGLAVLAATLRPDDSDLAALPPRLLAFAGIGRPEKFFATLRVAGHPPVGTMVFADHHRYRAADLDAIRRRATVLDAVPVTTAKDRVRLPRDFACQTLGVHLHWSEPALIDALLAKWVAA